MGVQLLQAVFGPRGSPIQMPQYSTFVTSIVEAYTAALRTLYEAGARKFIITVSSGTLTPCYNIESCTPAPCKHMTYCRGMLMSNTCFLMTLQCLDASYTAPNSCRSGTRIREG